ncbi:MAG: D-alanyl-D-alanine carboxypeptidase family protein [Eubacterium sp.]
MKQFISGLLVFFLLLFAPLSASAQADTSRQNTSEQNTSNAGVPTVSAPSYLLMDADTGTILTKKDENKELPLASVTKVMTLLLIFEALDHGKINLSDTVTVSEHAAGMGGSQVYLEPNETQTVETMIKCITIASANDACVAMAEFVSGSEDAFVAQMNQKAADLGMAHTHFVNSCGLDADGHYSSAYDIALMSRELTTRFPQIFDYTKIWMEDITHKTARGESSFTLSNTNRLIKQYEYATGLKTGSTGKAKFCLSATATKDDIHLIAVIMAAEDSKKRVADAKALFTWGFANCKIYSDENTDLLPEIPVKNGNRPVIQPYYEKPFRYLDTTGSSEKLTKKLNLPKQITAPVLKGDVIGKALYYLGEKQIGEISVLSKDTVEELTLEEAILKVARMLLLGKQTV